MKKVFLIVAAIALLSISIAASAADDTTDLWDVNQGCEVTGMYTAGVYVGSDIRNMFGGEFGTIEVGHTIFYDAQIFGPGSIAWVSWKTPSAVELGRFVFSVAADGNYPTSYNRAVQGFNLYASNIAHTYDDNWGNPIYASGPLPTPLGSHINGIYNYTIDHTFADPISAQHFKADIIYGSSVTGPRVIELDGYAPVPEPSSIMTLIGGLGSLLAFRRRRA
jgi:hypothetical protein